MATGAFLLPTDLSLVTLQQIAFYAFDFLELDQDRIVFPEGGGDVDRDLAVPFLPGMDEVVVRSARLTVHGVDEEASITGWHSAPGPGDQGTFIVLDGPARLRRFVMSEPPVVIDAYFILRAATVNQNGVPTAGAPVASEASFSSGPMLPPPLGVMTVTGRGSGTLTVTLPTAASQTVGQAWLIQLGGGDSINELAPTTGAPTISSVTILPAPEDISLTLRAGDGAAEQPLWQHPGAMLESAADQFADFTPAASGRLSSALEASNSAGGSTPTLGLPLRFHSERGGTLGVKARDLEVSYLAHPLGAEKIAVALDGGWRPLVLSAPERVPAASSLALTAKHRGLLVNAGSGVPPLSMPSGGIRVRAGRVVAGRASWSPPDGASGLLSRVRLLASPIGDTEVVCEVRRDAGGLPGELVAPPAVTIVSRDAGAGFVSVPLATPVSLPGGTLWITARTNRGEFDWFLDDSAAPQAASGSSRISTDGGVSWGEAEGGLTVHGPPVVQLLERVDPATQPIPSVLLYQGPVPLGSMLLSAGGAQGEYRQPSPAVLPPALLGALGAPGSQARRDTTVSLWSPALLDMSITALTTTYAPS